MNLESTQLENATVISVSGRLDVSSAPLLENRCAELVKQGVADLILDFEKLEYISSAGLRAIVSTGKTVQKSGGRLIVSGAKRSVKEVFEVSGFSAIFTMAPALKEALSILAR